MLQSNRLVWSLMYVGSVGSFRTTLYGKSQLEAIFYHSKYWCSWRVKCFRIIPGGLILRMRTMLGENSDSSDTTCWHRIAHTAKKPRSTITCKITHKSINRSRHNFTLFDHRVYVHERGTAHISHMFQLFSLRGKGYKLHL